MQVSVLNAARGDFTADFDTDDESGRKHLAEFVADMLAKGYALFLEDGDETHRITKYDADAQTFEVVASKERRGRAKIRVAEDTAPAAAAPSVRGGGSRRRVTAVAPSAGG